MPFKVDLETVDRKWSFRVAIAGPTLLDLMNGQEIPIKSSCLGKGICHQCRIQLQSGGPPPSAADKKAFSDGELSQGWRLSCTMRPKTRVQAYFPQAYTFTEDVRVLRQPQSDYQAAIDLGTTGIEITLVDDKGVWCEAKALNRLVLYGSDIMTRVECSQKRGVEILNKKLTTQLKKLFEKLDANNSTDFSFTGKWVFAGNSVMSAIVQNQSLASLAVAPYEPDTLEGQTSKTELGRWETLPLLHSFIGGDLTAGLFSLWEPERGLDKTPWVLIDVGTNSEILFWDGEQLFISSTPAGPAFEGANISIGMRAENGAVVNPTYDSDQGGWKFDVIGGDLAKGICGSALIDMIAEACRGDLIKADGEVIDEESLRLNDRLMLSQADVREFQLAKSAIRTGVELVMRESDVIPVEIKLAGNFGEHLHQDNCRALGLFPNLPTSVVGNTSLSGVQLWASSSDETKTQFQEWLAEVRRPIELALKDEFQEAFIRFMELK